MKNGNRPKNLVLLSLLKRKIELFMHAVSLREISQGKANSIAQNVINAVEGKLQGLAEEGRNKHHGYYPALSKELVVDIVHRHFTLLGFEVQINDDEYLNLTW